MIKFVAMAAVASMVFFAGDIQQAQGQYVTTYYAPAPVHVVPVRRGLFGYRTAYYAPVAPVASYYAPAPVVVAPTVAWSPVVRTCHTHYTPTVTLRPFAPVVRTYYRPW
ncbi:MAG: hypothetical protein ACR2NP_03095 [Pirellulaceae bacterium]